MGEPRPRQPPHNPSPQTAPPPGRSRDKQPPRSEEDCPTGRDRPPGPVRDRLLHTRQLHTPPGETKPHGRGSRNIQTRPGTTRPGQDQRGTNKTSTHMHHPRTRPRRGGGGQRLSPHPRTHHNTQLGREGSERPRYLHTRRQPHNPRPNTCTPNPNRAGANQAQPTSTHTHRGPWPGPEADRRKPEPGHEPTPKPKSGGARGGFTPKAKRTRQTTVGNQVSIAQA